MFTDLDPLNPIHRAVLGCAALIGITLGVLIADVLIPALVAAQLEATQ